jgi:hypothetical protein
VLNGDPAQSIRPEVCELILKTARQQGYRPNALARALKRRRTGALAFVIPLLRNPIWVRLQRGALQRAGPGNPPAPVTHPGRHRCPCWRCHRHPGPSTGGGTFTVRITAGT